MSTKKTMFSIFVLALASCSLTFASETIEPNETIDRLYNCEVFARNIWSQVYLSPQLKDIPSSLGFTIGDLLTNAYLYKDEEGTRIEPRVYIVENNVRLRLDVPKDEGEDVAGLVFNFSVEDFSIKDPGGVIEGNIAEGHGAILTDAYVHFDGIRTGETLEQLAAAKLLKVMLMDPVSETNPNPKDIAEATKKARRALSEKVDIQFEYKDIDSGPYGIPLNASLDKVISWCNEKNIQVTESVKKVPVFESVEFVEDGQIRKVKDHEFIERLYKIELAPSEELRNEQIGNITIYFQKTSADDYISYAVLFCYSRHHGPYVTLNTMTQVLNQKYGKFKIIPTSSKDKRIGSEIHTLTGMDFNYTEATIWKRNIILLGKFMYNKDQAFPPLGTPTLEPANRHEPFYLLYFTPVAGTSIPKAYQNAIEMCKKNYLQEKEESKKRMVETF